MVTQIQTTLVSRLIVEHVFSYDMSSRAHKLAKEAGAIATMRASLFASLAARCALTDPRDTGDNHQGLHAKFLQ